MQHILFDARSLTMYPVAKPGFHGGTETYLARVASGLAARGHIVHVVAPDLDRMEQRSAGEFWWGPDVFPTDVDVAVLVPGLEHVGSYSADKLICMSNGIDPYLGPDNSWASGVDAFPVFSECHKRMLIEVRKVDPGKCFITGLGVDIGDYDPLLPKVPARLLWSNDPTRGLLSLLHIFRELKQTVPEATLHIGYSFERQFEHHRWNQNVVAEALWECKRLIAEDSAITVLPELDRPALLKEEHECQIHVMPSDPTGPGTQIHGLLQAEIAATGTPLVLSDIEAFPEVFGGAALILPVPGTFLPDQERRYDAQDWAEQTVGIMQNKEIWQDMSKRSRALAETMTWAHVIDHWQGMLTSLGGEG